jgi:hypothetical protein
MFNDDQPTEAQKQRVLAQLRNQGIARIEATFSGGNDEGGIDSVTFFDAEGNEVAAPPQPSVYRAYQGGTSALYAGGWGDDRRLATAEEVAQDLVWKVIEHPVYDRYYTFAGEFYVDGTLTWDVAAGTHKMSGQESHQVWEGFEV